MIEEISFKNILSFKNEVTLSFEALPDDELESAFFNSLRQEPFVF